MEVTRVETLEYEPPRIEILDTVELLEKLGPAVTCSGFEGAVTGCN